MDLLFSNKEELIGNVIISFNVGCSGCKTITFEIQRGARKEIAEHKRADLRVFKEEVSDITASLKGLPGKIFGCSQPVCVLTLNFTF